MVNIRPITIYYIGNVSDLLLKILYSDDTCVIAQGHNLHNNYNNNIQHLYSAL